jgi:RNA polymerase sigma-70 factor (ECF subfamily)
VKREQPLVRLAEDSSARLESLCAGDQTSPSQVAVRAEEVLQLADALETLSEEQRSAVVAYYWCGSTLAEIGHDLHRTGPAVAGLIYRGVKRLKQHLAGCG